jgi:tetratricopeptide (TPR) repeat protein
LRKLSLLFSVIFVFSGCLWAASSGDFEAIVQNLKQGRANEALQQVNTVLARNPQDAQALNLRCRVYYEEEMWDQAVSSCEAAVQAEPGNSGFHDWLGRAYGEKASTASLMAAYRLAHKVAAQFQQAVQLDPHNVQALEDLGQFDVSAPLVAGGGLSRAASVARQLQGVDAAAALTLEARIAEARHDYTTAENDYTAAIGKSTHPAAGWMELAAFYLRRGRYDDMVAAARRGVTLDTANGPALVDGAEALAQARRDPQTAIQWLREYLHSDRLSEDAPAFVVRTKLAQLLAGEGDAAGAQRELASARALAAGYRIPDSIPSAKAGF